jgi:hypothetical protein
MNPSASWYLNPVLLTPIVGLVGVVIGGGITAISTYILDEKREQRQQERENRNATIEFKRAARMLDRHLSMIGATVQSVIEDKDFGNFRASVISGQRPADLVEFQNILAARLSEDSWQSVIVALAAVNGIDALCEKFARMPAGKQEIPEKLIPNLEELLRGIEGGHEPLNEFLRELE